MARRFLLTSIPGGHEVRLIEDRGDWYRVGTFYQNKYIESYIQSDQLTKGIMPMVHLDTPKIPSVHLWSESEVITPSSKEHSLVINDPKCPERNLTSVTSRVMGINMILNYLDVEKSERYLASGRNSYCNVYVHDYAYLCGVYLPRVWWSDKAVAALTLGKKVDKRIDVSVYEIGASKLYDWLTDWGGLFGWKRVFDPHEAQESANNGQVVLISAKRSIANTPGHICIIAPENFNIKAIRENGRVSIPVMSHAGNKNRKYFQHRWWTHKQFKFFGFWVAE